MVYPQSGKKLIIVSILSILVLSFVTFGTLAYFRQTDRAYGVIGVGSDITISTTNITKEFTNLTANSTLTVGSTVTKNAGVKAKLRVFVTVSLVDSSTGNIIKDVTDDAGNPYFTVNMNSITGAQWVKETGVVTNSPQYKAGFYWRYLMKSSNANEAFEVITGTNYTLCSSISVNRNYNLTGCKLVVTTTVEVLQYNNINW